MVCVAVCVCLRVRLSTAVQKWHTLYTYNGFQSNNVPISWFSNAGRATHNQIETQLSHVTEKTESESTRP
jgi:hypothetical protein